MKDSIVVFYGAPTVFFHEVISSHFFFITVNEKQLENCYIFQENIKYCCSSLTSPSNDNISNVMELKKRYD